MSEPHEAEFLDWAAVALAALLSPSIRLAHAEKRVPPCPGLYAIFGARSVWRELDLGNAPDRRPLYVGKSESSLAGRDLEDHFGPEAETGWSSPRRSFAALLRDTLDLRAIPRNPEKPGEFDRFGLSHQHEAALTGWMRRRLRLAVWPRPDECRFQLRLLESEIVRRLQPPINLTHVSHRWKRPIRDARRVMADEARASAAA